MSDPIQDFINAGGFRPVADPESEQVRERARGLVHAALRLVLDGTPDSAERLPDVWEKILRVNRHGGGVVCAVEELVFIWRRLIGLYLAFPPVWQDEPWVRASQVATGLTVPAAPDAPVALTLEAAQDDKLAIALLATFTGELARRLREASQVLDEINKCAEVGDVSVH